MYSHDGLVNPRIRVLFCPIPVFILSYIVVHFGENQANFSKIMYIRHFQFFLSDSILYCSLLAAWLIHLQNKMLNSKTEESCCL